MTVASTAVKDSAGNFYAGISSTTALSFLTATSGSAFSLTGAFDNITGTGGDDVFTGTYGNAAGGTFNGINDTLNGGAGTDSLTLTIGAFATTSPDADFTNISNFESMIFNTTGAGAQTITGGAEFDGAFTATIDLTAQTTSGAITIDLNATNKAATVTAITSVFGAQTITTGSGVTTVNATTNEDAQTISGANLLAVNATATKGAQTITSTGASTVTVTAIAGDGNQTITTAGGDDVVTLTSKAGSLNSITTGLGNDTIVASLGTDLITGGGGTDTMTGGAGVDTFVFTTASDSNAAVAGAIDWIKDFVGGTDKLKVGVTGAELNSETSGSAYAAMDTISELNNLLNSATGTSTAKFDGVGVDVAKITTNDNRILAAIDVDGSGTFTAADVVVELTGLTGVFAFTDIIV